MGLILFYVLSLALQIFSNFLISIASQIVQRIPEQVKAYLLDQNANELDKIGTMYLECMYSSGEVGMVKQGQKQGHNISLKVFIFCLLSLPMVYVIMLDLLSIRKPL